MDRIDRRKFLLTSYAAALAANIRAATTTATVLYGERSTRLDRVRADGRDLWVRASDLPRINEFELKPQGACRADLCIPITQNLKQGEWFNLTGFARNLHEAFVADSGVWSFGEIPVLQGSFLNSRVAPDFAVPDRKGRLVHLSDFRGKKILLLTWSSW